MKRIFKWFFMLSKRLYKKPSFIALLVLVVICVFSFRLSAKQDSGFVHITLAQEIKEDGVSRDIINELTKEDSIIRFSVSDTAEAALEAVRSGKADEAWIFPSIKNEKIVSAGSVDYVVDIVTREQSVALRLAREKLTASLYKYCARAYYLDYIRTNISALDTLSDQKLIAYFDEVGVDEELFVFGTAADASAHDTDTNYLISPIRGLLAVLAVICGMAATMFFLQDDAAGTFSHVKQTARPFTAFGCVETAVLNFSAVLLLSIYISGLATSLLRELIALLLYTFCCTAFCLLLRSVFSNIGVYSTLIPIIAVLLICVCPVFFDLRALSSLQMLLPPTYYVNAIYDRAYLLYMVAFAFVCFALSLIINKLRRKF